VTAVFRVLFVCTANQCRSAMAEEMSRRILGSRQPIGAGALEFSSAGTEALDGSPATGGTMRVMRGAGLDLSRHRSRGLDRRILADADLVLAMTTEHAETVLSYERSAARRTFTLAAFARAVAGRGAGSPDELVDLANELRGASRGDEPLDDDIIDPVGRGEAAHLACAERLGKLVSDAVEALAGGAQAVGPR
jgi:protein-tyrosine phosphatase